MIITKKLPTQFEAGTDKGLIRKALLCRTGSFDGMNGPVDVTKEMLEGLCATYIEAKSQPQNDNDFAPLLIDHERKADNVMGRLLPRGMEVKEWREVDGEMQFGLYGELRIDDKDAILKVGTGKYANLSISFDEDSNEIFEVSFVAVEAARGSIILSKNHSTGGTKMATAQKLMSLSKKHKALSAHVMQSHSKRQAALSAIISTTSKVEKEITSLMKKTGEITLSIKASQLKAQFNEFVREGKMNPVELKDLDFKELCSLSDTARKILLASYSNRSVSTDVMTFGQSSDKKTSLDLSPAAVRERMELQRSGKTVSLAEEIPEKKEDEKLSEENTEDKKSYSLSEEEHAKHMQDMMECHQKLGECVEKIKSMGQDAEKISDEDKQDEKKELKEMSDESESEDMGADDEEKDEKSNTKEKGE